MFVEEGGGLWIWFGDFIFANLFNKLNISYNVSVSLNNEFCVHKDIVSLYSTIVNDFLKSPIRFRKKTPFLKKNVAVF